MTKLRAQWEHVKPLSQIWRHFQNPWLIMLLRLGFIKLPYFPYRLQKGSRHYTMLARPTTTSLADLFVLREVLIEETYQEILPLLPSRNVRLLDVGANLGSFSIWMHQTVGVREAYCFEPEPDSFRLLDFNLALNKCTMAKAIPCAMGGVARTISVALKKTSPGGTSIYSNNTGSPEAVPVPVIAFEQWMKTTEGEFDLLKMDCEGAEWEILDHTSPQELARFGVFVAEVHADPSHGHQVSEFEKITEKLGFRTVRWDGKPQGLYIGVRK